MEYRELNVLYLDDEDNNLVSFKSNLRRYYNIFTAICIKDAYDILQENSIQVVVSDQRMPSVTGVEFLKEVSDKYPDSIRILLTGYSDLGILIDAFNQKIAYRYLMKPVNDFELKITLDNAFELYYLRKENIELKRRLK